MKNFQLYRTNLLLGGQMKWDVVIHSNGKKLEVRDFHLRPISDNVKYIDRLDENLLNNTHLDNIKLYYKKNKGIFYEEGLDSIFNHNYPVITRTDDKIKCYSDIYDCGCKRTNNYTRYNKQFELFCPLWIEHLDGDLKFKLNLYSINDDKTVFITSKELIFDIDNNIYSDYHNRFISYFKDYIKSIGIDNGNEDLINVNFNKTNAYISGVDVSTGLVVTKDVNELITNFISRERPIMEVDNMIMQSFVNKKLLAKQLFNFNICFNLDDIITSQIANLLIGKYLKITVDTYVGDKMLEKKDFYTNYEYIERVTADLSEVKNGMNVFDYLCDNKALELINKNKYCQSICHWSLIDNNEYIFNLYDGFSGVAIDESGNITENEHNYLNYPDLYSAEANEKTNSSFWINIERVKDFSDYYKYFMQHENIDNFKYYAKRINSTDKFIGNLRYREFSNASNNEAYYILGLLADNEAITVKSALFDFVVDTAKSDNYSEITTNLPEDINFKILVKDNYIAVVSDDINNFAYKNFVNIVKTIEIDASNRLGNNNVINFIKHICNEKIDPSVVLFRNGLVITKAFGPRNNHSEVEYFKNDNHYNYVFRYDGKLKPTFVDSGNFIYYKDYISNEAPDFKLQNSTYKEYLKYNIQPLYPSINYCAIKKLDNYSYDSLPDVNVSEHNDDVKLNPFLEYSWYNDNKHIWLNDTIKLSITKPSDDIKADICDYLNEYYGFNECDEFDEYCEFDEYDECDNNISSYILEKYNVITKILNEGDKIVYNITLKLK